MAMAAAILSCRMAEQSAIIAMNDYAAYHADITALRGELLLAAEGCDLPREVKRLLRQAAAALGAVDLCCEGAALAAAESA